MKTIVVNILFFVEQLKLGFFPYYLWYAYNNLRTTLLNTSTKQQLLTMAKAALICENCILNKCE